MPPVPSDIGRQIVRKHTGGTAEDTIPDLYAFVNADVVLNLHVIAYMHIICDVDILSQTAIIANGRACLYVTKMPDFGVGANMNIVVNI